MNKKGCNECGCHDHLSDAACDCPCHWSWTNSDYEVEVGYNDDVATDIWDEFHNGKD